MTGPTLTAPFKNAKTLNKGGKDFTYVPASEIIDRLNAVLGTGEWRFAVEVVSADDTFIVVKGRLTACGGLYEQFGGQVINKKRDGSVLDLGDDYKGAASDAFKKCAQMIGVGLYIALEHEPLSAKTTGEGASQEAAESVPSPVNPSEGGNPPDAATAGASTPTPPSEPSPASDAGTSAPPAPGRSPSGVGTDVRGSASVPDTSDQDPETRRLIDRFNNLPLEAKAEALGFKKKLGIQNWYEADADLLSKMRARVAELEGTAA